MKTLNELTQYLSKLLKSNNNILPLSEETGGGEEGNLAEQLTDPSSIVQLIENFSLENMDPSAIENSPTEALVFVIYFILNTALKQSQTDSDYKLSEIFTETKWEEGDIISKDLLSRIEAKLNQSSSLNTVFNNLMLTFVAQLFQELNPTSTVDKLTESLISTFLEINYKGRPITHMYADHADDDLVKKIGDYLGDEFLGIRHKLFLISVQNEGELGGEDALITKGLKLIKQEFYSQLTEIEVPTEYAGKYSKAYSTHVWYFIDSNKSSQETDMQYIDYDFPEADMTLIIPEYVQNEEGKWEIEHIHSADVTAAAAARGDKISFGANNNLRLYMDNPEGTLYILTNETAKPATHGFGGIYYCSAENFKIKSYHDFRDDSNTLVIAGQESSLLDCNPLTYINFDEQGNPVSIKVHEGFKLWNLSYKKRVSLIHPTDPVISFIY